MEQRGTRQGTRPASRGVRSPVRTACVCLLPLLATVTIGAAEDETGEADDAAALQQLLEGMTSYQASFRQTLLDRFGETLQVATGDMHLQRPGRLRWQVDEPYPQLVLADGESLWVYDPDLQQASVQPLAEAIEGSPAVYLTGVAEKVDSRFRVGAVPMDDGYRFVLRPRRSGSVFRDATLTFSAEKMLIALDIVDHLQQATRIAFADAQLNPVLESNLFRFEIPPGVDVIGDVPTQPSKQRDGAAVANDEPAER